MSDYQSPSDRVLPEIADPGDAGAIPPRSGHCAMTSGAGAETRTLAVPTRAGLLLSCSHSVDGGGAIALTVANGINAAGNTVITSADAGDNYLLQSVQVGATFQWKLVIQDGTLLS